LLSAKDKVIQCYMVVKHGVYKRMKLNDEKHLRCGSGEEC